MVVPFMDSHTPIPVLTDMPLMGGMDMGTHFTAIMGLVHASTVGGGEVAITAEVGEAAMAGGDDIVGIETKIMHQDHLFNSCWYLKNNLIRKILQPIQIISIIKRILA